MKPEVKVKVCAALRSGQYKQGLDMMRDHDDCYCVNGVIADVVDPEGWTPSKFGAIPTHRGQMGMPGYSVIAAAGMTEDQVHELIDLNDSYHLDFPALAEYIERTM
jgi:hypothetical protein